jgi:hypothetical protein
MNFLPCSFTAEFGVPISFQVWYLMWTTLIQGDDTLHGNCSNMSWLVLQQTGLKSSFMLVSVFSFLPFLLPGYNSVSFWKLQMRIFGLEELSATYKWVTICFLQFLACHFSPGCI